MTIRPQKFQTLILDWFDKHGRKHLPWQQNKTPYRVWISEIMLQQTQVNTVIPYYQKFIQKFRSLRALANASEDEVLHLWSGLGYYSRARNLHRAAKMVVHEFKGKFPDNSDDLQKLPGIGQSTAGAILSIAFNQQAAILDGNVKRVLARFHGITQPVNEKKVVDELWEYAEQYMPAQRAADYTQAMMDLGATLCTRDNPQCHHCPLVACCAAHQQGIAHLLPAKKTTRALPERSATFLILKKDDGQVLLRKRPPMGIWGGLWSFPEIPGEPEIKAIQTYCRQHWQVTIKKMDTLTPFRHTFSHYHLHIHPVIMSVTRMPFVIMEDDRQIWYNPHKPESVGLPKPVKSMIKNLP